MPIYLSELTSPLLLLTSAAASIKSILALSEGQTFRAHEAEFLDIPLSVVILPQLSEQTENI